jgi:hypothetical protein
MFNFFKINLHPKNLQLEKYLSLQKYILKSIYDSIKQKYINLKIKNKNKRKITIKSNEIIKPNSNMPSIIFFLSIPIIYFFSK